MPFETRKEAKAREESLSIPSGSILREVCVVVTKDLERV